MGLKLLTKLWFLAAIFVDLATSQISPDATSLISQPLLEFINDTSLTFSWTLTLLGSRATLPTNFEIEVSNTHFSEDYSFVNAIDVVLPDQYSNNSLFSTYTATRLQPGSDYSFRVTPTFGSGRGYSSKPLIVTTLPISKTYWEPVVYRRLSLALTARGFTNPVLQRPHLSTGVEIYDDRTSDNELRFSDPTTSETPVYPAGRRGHSLTAINDVAYLFGGRTNGNIFSFVELYNVVQSFYSL